MTPQKPLASRGRMCQVQSERDFEQRSAVSTEQSPSADQLYGTWRLVVAKAFDVNGRLLPPPYGPVPMGRIVLNRDGRMMAVLCDGRPSLPFGEVRNYASYCGNFRIENNRLITTVDAADSPDRIGSQQVRRLAFRDGYLVLMPPPSQDGSQRELLWQRDGPP